MPPHPANKGLTKAMRDVLLLTKAMRVHGLHDQAARAQAQAGELERRRARNHDPPPSAALRSPYFWQVPRSWGAARATNPPRLVDLGLLDLVLQLHVDGARRASSLVSAAARQAQGSQIGWLHLPSGWRRSSDRDRTHHTPQTFASACVQGRLGLSAAADPGEVCRLAGHRGRAT